MSKKQRHKPARALPQSTYKLGEIQDLVRQGKCVINKDVQETRGVVMKCYECGGNSITETASIVINDSILGPVTVPNITQSRCDQCGDTLLSCEESDKITDCLERLLDARIKRNPITAFVSAQEACSILGITRQAFHKNRRIKRGFILQASIAGQVLYLRKSVELFKIKGDGRYPLFDQTSERRIPIEAKTQPSKYPSYDLASIFPSARYLVSMIPPQVRSCHYAR
ncbi:MAG: hypothetical protein NTX50_16910 [Candidatus Sumerlaeota bacterium]|nr:hypothetical protein [Candidatus Sumerlaeota bacterium]